MEESLEADASRFDEIAPASDGDRGPEYEAALSLVVEHAAPQSDEVVLDVGTGTGAVAPALADEAARVPDRDTSEDMLERAKERAAERTPTSVEFDTGRFGETEPSEPFYTTDGDGPATVGVLVAERSVAPGGERVER